MIGIHPITEADIRKLLSKTHKYDSIDVLGQYYDDQVKACMWNYLCSVSIEKKKNGIRSFNTERNVEIIKNTLGMITHCTITELKEQENILPW